MLLVVLYYKRSKAGFSVNGCDLTRDVPYRQSGNFVGFCDSVKGVE